jgi:hypothetical protein
MLRKSLLHAVHASACEAHAYHALLWLPQGNINLIRAAAAKGVKKFVLVTSIGTGDSRDAPPSQVYDVLKPVLLEKEKAEAALKVGALGK